MAIWLKKFEFQPEAGIPNFWFHYPIEGVPHLKLPDHEILLSCTSYSAPTPASCRHLNAIQPRLQAVGTQTSFGALHQIVSDWKLTQHVQFALQTELQTQHWSWETTSELAKLTLHRHSKAPFLSETYNPLWKLLLETMPEQSSVEKGKSQSSMFR